MRSKLFKFGVRSLVLIGASAAIIVALTNTAPGQGCYLVEPGGLIGWWRAEGNAADSAGAHPGTLVNGAGFAAGKVGLGFTLNGEGQYVALSPNIFFNYPNSGIGNGPFFCCRKQWEVSVGQQRGAINNERSAVGSTSGDRSRRGREPVAS